MRRPVNGGAGRSEKSTRWRCARACSSVRSGLRILLRVLDAQALLQLAVLRVERAAPHRVEQVGDDADHAGRVEDVNGRRAS